MNLLSYLSQYDIIFSVTIPLIFSIGWLVTEARSKPPPNDVLWHWMICTIIAYLLSYWVLTEETRELHGTNVMFIYISIYLFIEGKLTALTAYALTFLSMLVVDAARAIELPDKTWDTFYDGIGGAGLRDALFIIPLASALLVWYVNWRRK